MKQNFWRMIKAFKKELRYLMSNKSPVLFDHLPKCGGTTINLYLSNHYPNRFVFRISGIHPQKSIDEFRSLSKKKRRSKRLIYGHDAHKLHGLTHPNTLNITVFREPVDRIISHYYYVKQTKTHYLHDIVTRKQISLNDYCSSGLSKELTNWYVTHFTEFSLEEIEKNPKKSVDLALKNILEMYDLIGFQEDIPVFMNQLKDKLSLKMPRKLDKKNVTKNRLQIIDIKQDTIENIIKYNNLDIQLYTKLVALKKNGIIVGNKFLSN